MFTRPNSKITLQANQGDGYRYMLISLFLLLLCFFVMLNSLAEKNSKKGKAVTQNLRYEFMGKDWKDKLKTFNDSGSIVGAYKVFGIKEKLEKFMMFNKLDDASVNQFDKYLSFSLRNNIIFFEGDESLKYTGTTLLREISKLLNNYDKYGNLSVMVVVSSEPGNYDLALKRIRKIKSIISYNLRDESSLKFSISSYKNQKDSKVKFILSFND